MSTSMDLFAALEARDAGMEIAVSSKGDVIGKVRYQLASIARMKPDRCVTIDDAAPFLEAEGIELGNAAGSVFKSDMWQFTDRWKASSRKSSHARHVRVWRLK